MNHLNMHPTITATPPPGNLVDLHYYVFGIGSGVATLLCFLRLCSRHHLRTLGRDDFAIQMKTMCYHSKDIPDDRSQVYAELSYNAAPAFMMSIGCAKMSILCFYLRTFPSQCFQTTARITQGLVVMVTFPITLLLYLSRFEHLGLDDVALFLATAGANVAMDALLLALPIPTVFALQMSWKKKSVVTCFFSLGLITMGTSIVRLYLLKGILGSSDLTWDAAPANITSFLEVNFHLICACMPAVYKFFKELKCFKAVSPNPTYQSHVSGTWQPTLRSSSQILLHEIRGGFDVESGRAPSRGKSSGTASDGVDDPERLPDQDWHSG
ncbi:hypothetical protein CGGC5_v017010 [Colletotrichum fructicola Nara gc5]|uniref:Rhodopsin domain-containing protein n=1 Tax=Colletotrichum fructicola (strain Nara gc5) TaxID=1213859 RepID=A0A7J6ID49_COLFN|nr:hypothetical protein CGGC5_v017010 [Colletotrichum fructicola Nara gc5]